MKQEVTYIILIVALVTVNIILEAVRRYFRSSCFSIRN
ncbi:hypothetical protein HMPREF9176_0440 [Streptococcus downei F0415]|nr:hypothetical protein HMPREF9176_0440 [Streptococcus downei F0415]